MTDLLVCKGAEQKYNAGDHLKVHCDSYTHQGIYVGLNKVIHYADTGVVECTLEEFSTGLSIEIVDSEVAYPRDEIVRRARMRLGENEYNLIDNNCRIFVRWCRSGIKE